MALAVVAMLLCLLSAFSIGSLLLRFLTSENKIPVRRRLIVTFVPLLILLTYAHPIENHGEVRRQSAIALFSAGGALGLWGLINLLKSNV